MKGQAAMEFFFLFGLSMFILAILFGFISQKQSNVFRMQNTEMAEDVASHVAFEAEMALAQGEGYSHVFYIPKEISGTNYTVRVGNETSYVGWNDRMASESTLYRGRVVKFNTDDSRVFKILHNSSGVYVVDG